MQDMSLVGKKGSRTLRCRRPFFEAKINQRVIELAGREHRDVTFVDGAKLKSPAAFFGHYSP